jgi:hypothetical protein
MKEKEELVIVKKFTYNDKEQFAVQQKATNGNYYTVIIVINGKSVAAVYDKENDAKRMCNLLKKLL